MRSAIVRLMLVASGLVIGLLISESALQTVNPIPEMYNPMHGFYQSDPRLGWIGKPNIRLRFLRPEFDVLVEH